MATAIKQADLFATQIALFDDVYINPSEVVEAAIVAVGNTGTPGGWDCNISSSYAKDKKFADQLPAFKAAILASVWQYSRIHFGKDVVMSESWANIAKSGQYQEQHDHIGRTGAVCSAVYYPQVGEGETLVFHSPYRTISYHDSTKSKTTLNVKQNRMFVFPVYLEHSFKAIERSTDKISIAFNFVVR